MPLETGEPAPLPLATCPTDAELAAFVGGRSHQRTIIEGHLDVCAACRTLVAHLFGASIVDTAPPATDTAPNNPLKTTAPLLFGPEPERALDVYEKGTRLGRYVIERQIGRGGMGVVFEAFDSELHRRVAAKVVRDDAADAHGRARFKREARAMAKVAHPNVVTVFDVGETDDGRVFLAMELVEGSSLRPLIRERRPLTWTLDAFIQAARGLAAAHAVGLVHRDFKPDNVLVGTDGRVRVTDFGLVRAADGRAGAPNTLVSGGPLTGAGTVVGTPAYMAPEQHLGLEVTAKADQFALAASLYEAIVGTRLFARTDYAAVRMEKLEQKPTPWPADHVLPDELRAAIDRALMRDPEHRHPDVASFAAVLERVHRNLSELRSFSAPQPPFAPPATPSPRVIVTSTPTGGSAAQPAAPASSNGGATILIVAAILLLGAAASGVAVLIARGDSTRGAASTADATPPAVPVFEPVVKNASLDSTLPCPSGSSQEVDRDGRWLHCRAPRAEEVPGTEPEGPSLWFHPGGALAAQETYRGGQLSGLRWELDGRGHVTLVSSWKNGVREGAVIEVHPNGKPKSEMTYVQGTPDGVARRWRDDGTLEQWTRYEKGRVVERKDP